MKLPRWLIRRFQMETTYVFATFAVAITGFLIKLVNGPKWAPEAAFDTIIVMILLFVVGLLMKQQQRQSSLLKMEIITDAKELYNHFFFELGRSEERVCLSHIRQTNFSDTKVNQDFQDQVAGWANADENRRVLRLAAVGNPEDSSNEVAYELAAKSKGVAGYQVRGLIWEPKTPFANFAIFDNTVAFVCFYEGRDEGENRAAIWAMRITDSATVSRLAKYFETLWGDDETLDEEQLLALGNK